MALSRTQLPYGRQVLLLALFTGLPATLTAGVLLGQSRLSPAWQWLLGLALAAIWLALAVALYQRVVRPLRTLSSLLAALREGDFSSQAHGAEAGDPLGQVLLEMNGLTDILREQRLGALEATAILRTVMEEINVAVFAFDDRQRLRLANRAGEKLLAQPVERLTGHTASELGLGECLEGEPSRTIQAVFAGSRGRFGLRRNHFRQGGLPHQLLVLTDLSQALREEEREAWQRLLRVLGHELNNSLTPIKSIAASLGALLAREPLPADWKEDLERGLKVVSSRAEALSRFMEAYSRLARLPQPRFHPVPIGQLLTRIAGLETRRKVEVTRGPELTLDADPDQLEQLLINLVRNATDAALEAHGQVHIGWAKAGSHLEIQVADEGPGLANTANLFVPFFTTKPGGSGIGLALSRQIAEAHHGSLTLENRKDRAGCVAKLRLPLGRTTSGTERDPL